MKNVMNKVIVAMMMMAIANVMPAMADNHRNVHSGRRENTIVVNNHHNNHHHAYRPDVKSCTIKVSRHTPHHRVAAKAERIKGVMETRWNPRTRELTVRYDAHVTSARNIKRAIA